MRDDLNAPPKFSLVLASQSPRRKELLGWLSIGFEQISADIEEVSLKVRPHEIAEDLAWQKGEVILTEITQDNSYKNIEHPLVISSDTIVCLGDEILGKPKDRDEAREMLKKLSGKTHTVYTGVAIQGKHPSFEAKELSKTFHGSTQVHFCEIEPETLEAYLDSGDSLDKAGAYGIQGMGLSFIKGVEGSYSNVVGLPLAEVAQCLKEVLGPYPDSQGSWRSWFTKL